MRMFYFEVHRGTGIEYIFTDSWLNTEGLQYKSSRIWKEFNGEINYIKNIYNSTTQVDKEEFLMIKMKSTPAR